MSKAGRSTALEAPRADTTAAGALDLLQAVADAGGVIRLQGDMLRLSAPASCDRRQLTRLTHRPEQARAALLAQSVAVAADGAPAAAAGYSTGNILAEQRLL